MTKPELSIVVVSHAHSEHVRILLESIQQYPPECSTELILIDNLAGSTTKYPQNHVIPIRYFINNKPKGFSKNINSAFQIATGDYFCVLNPDVILNEEIFGNLIAQLKTTNIDIIAPLVIDESGRIQDSFRDIPTPWEIVYRAFFKKEYSVDIEDSDSMMIYPQWIAATCLLMPSKVFSELSGFDEKYRLYFEDVDFCCRARNSGYKIAVTKGSTLLHNAQRESKKNIKYAFIHTISAFKFFLSSAYWVSVKKKYGTKN